MIAVSKGFAKSPEQLREVLLLRLVEGLNFKEVSLQMRIPLEASASLFRNAISSLRNEIGEY